MLDFFSSFISSTLANLFPLLFSKKETPHVEIDQEEGRGNTGINYGTVQHTTTQYINSPSGFEFKFKDSDAGSIKKNARILFVDDKSQASIVKNLTVLGWQLVEELEQDNIQNTTCEKYQDADLIFVDFDGIGPPRRGQGLSILRSLMASYGRKKYYILHTAHSAKITLQKLEENGLSIQDGTGWSLLTKGSPDYLLETMMLSGLKKIEK